jgi:uncharacterized protein (DUF952 family)
VTLIYHIATAADWEQARRDGRFNRGFQRS